MLFVLVLFALSLSSQGVSAKRLDFDRRHKGHKNIFKKEIIDIINNNPSSTWTAGYNPRVHDLSINEFRGLLGSKRHHKSLFSDSDTSFPSNPSLSILPLSLSLPTSFDAREKWSYCPSLTLIRDQGHCGSCWAFGAVEAFNDRVCIHLNDTTFLSVNDLLACCGEFCGDGCEGGWPIKAWQYFITDGVVSDECRTYFDKEGCTHPGCSPVYETPSCNKTCENAEDYNSSKRYAQSAYYVSSNISDIMLELFTNGPIEVDFDVYEDFAYYKSGVYQHIFGELEGGHAVKLIGWGTTDEGIDYWLIANSWNTSWGEDGYFRILRGTNECGIEAEPVAGIPKNSYDQFA